MYMQSALILDGNSLSSALRRGHEAMQILVQLYGRDLYCLTSTIPYTQRLINRNCYINV